jgi:hypothetical protein
MCGADGSLRRRNRPISPSTPPFSCAPALPGTQKNESNLSLAAAAPLPAAAGPSPAIEEKATTMEPTERREDIEVLAHIHLRKEHINLEHALQTTYEAVYSLTVVLL